MKNFSGMDIVSAATSIAQHLKEQDISTRSHENYFFM